MLCAHGADATRGRGRGRRGSCSHRSASDEHAFATPPEPPRLRRAADRPRDAIGSQPAGGLLGVDLEPVDAELVDVEVVLLVLIVVVQVAVQERIAARLVGDLEKLDELVALVLIER
jgi:hypothetical protein